MNWSKGPRWYDRQRLPYAVDRKLVRQYAEWLTPVPWQLFCTLTFAWRVSDLQADRIFAEFINRLERLLGCDVCYVRGHEERCSAGSKAASGRHYHVLLTSAARMDSQTIVQMWQSMAGGHDCEEDVATVYDANLDGASYALKFINDTRGDWDFRNLELFHPDVKIERLTLRMRRRLRRHAARVELLASTNTSAENGQFMLHPAK